MRRLHMLSCCFWSWEYSSVPSLSMYVLSVLYYFNSRLILFLFQTSCFLEEISCTEGHMSRYRHAHKTAQNNKTKLSVRRLNNATSHQAGLSFSWEPHGQCRKPLFCSGHFSLCLLWISAWTTRAPCEMGTCEKETWQEASHSCSAETLPKETPFIGWGPLRAEVFILYAEKWTGGKKRKDSNAENVMNLLFSLQNLEGSGHSERWLKVQGGKKITVWEVLESNPPVAVYNCSH